MNSLQEFILCVLLVCFKFLLLYINNYVAQKVLSTYHICEHIGLLLWIDCICVHRNRARPTMQTSKCTLFAMPWPNSSGILQKVCHCEKHMQDLKAPLSSSWIYLSLNLLFSHTGLKDTIEVHFALQREAILKQCSQWLKDSVSDEHKQKLLKAIDELRQEMDRHWEERVLSLQFMNFYFIL